MDHEQCHQLLGSLSEYVDGDLGPELCQEIERHMAGCDNCRIVVDTLRKTILLYRQVEPATGLPEGIRSRLFHRLELDDFLK